MVGHNGQVRFFKDRGLRFQAWCAAAVLVVAPQVMGVWAGWFAGGIVDEDVLGPSGGEAAGPLLMAVMGAMLGYFVTFGVLVMALILPKRRLSAATVSFAGALFLLGVLISLARAAVPGIWFVYGLCVVFVLWCVSVLVQQLWQRSLVMNQTALASSAEALPAPKNLL